MKYLIVIFALLLSSCDKTEPTGEADRRKPPKNITPPPPVQVIDTIDFNIVHDTSVCGTVHLTWAAIPGATSYVVYDNSPKTNGCPAALFAYTNGLYYTLGSGCYWFAMSTYEVRINTAVLDSQANIIYIKRSLPFTLQTGPFGANCN